MIVKKLDLHIITNIISTTLVVLFALLSIDMLGKIIAEIDILGDKDYSFSKLITYVLALIPLKLMQFFPMALLIGSLMGLGKIAASNELTVMQTSGISRLRIGFVGFSVSVILGCFMLIITEFVGAPAKEYAENMRAEALGKVSKTQGKKGFWAQDGNSFINIGGVQGSGELVNVTIYTLDEDMQFSNIKHAKRAKFIDKNWQLFDVKERVITESKINVIQSKEAYWANTLDYEVLGLLLSDPEDLSIRDLYKFINYQKANKIKPTNFSLILWQRLFVPLTAGVMFLLALPFVFGSQRNSSQGKKLFIGVLLGLAYFVSYSSISNIILLTGMPVILGAILPIILFLFISFGLLRMRN